MKAIVHEARRADDPKPFLSPGAPGPNPEQPARVDALHGDNPASFLGGLLAAHPETHPGAHPGTHAACG